MSRIPRQPAWPGWCLVRAWLTVTCCVAAQAAGQAAAPPEPIARWRLTPEHLSAGRTFRPLAGKLSATVVGPVRFRRDAPPALHMDGNSKARHRVDVTDDLAAARLPTEALSAEAWVLLDKTPKWGGFVGAMQDNGDYERGWILGHTGARFTFAVASRETGRLTYLKAARGLQTGYWYHVAGTYDGKELKLYVDGVLAGRSAEPGGRILYPPKAFYTLAAYRDDNELYTLAGRLEQVSVYDRALSAAEVRSLFRSRKGLFPHVEPEPPPAVRDWPTYMRDNRRSGAAPEALQLPLHLRWVHRARHAPQPAWPPPARQDYWHRKADLPARVTYDRAYHVVSVGEAVYVGSSADDKVVCLDARTGRTRWTFFAEGPVRLAPTIADGKVLFGSDDGFAYCLDAADGSLIWRHRLAPAERRIPGNGRIISMFPVRAGVVAADGAAHFCAGIFPVQGVYQGRVDLGTGRRLAVQRVESSPQGYMTRALGRLRVPTGRDPKGAVLSKARRRGKIAQPELPLPDYPYASITAGTVRIAGGEGLVAAFDPNDGSRLWSGEVSGRAYSLAAARGRLLVGTDKGEVYCFTPEAGPPSTVEAPDPVPPKWDAPATRRAAEGAERVLRTAGIRRGYGLLLGAGLAPLACELAERSELRIVLREPDAAKVASTRALLDAAGLYGRRIAVHHGPLQRLPYAGRLFNVVVADRRGTGRPGTPRAELLRVLVPGRGVAILGDGPGDVLRREPPAGGGQWTHTWGDPGNTACSGDRLVGGAMAVQWFGRPGPREMIDRHHRNTPPLAKDGRLFVPGDQVIFAVDASNGTLLWKAQVPHSRRLGVFLDCGSMALDDERLYVAVQDRCLALDVARGERRLALTMPQCVPGRKSLWGYVARVGDLVVGSGRKPNATYTETSRDADNALWHDHMKLVTSDYLFAVDRRGGPPRWTYRSGLIINPTIAIGDGRVYFVESGAPAALADKLGRMTMETFLPGPNHLVALDLKTGKAAWRKPLNLSNCRHIVYLSCAGGKLILSGNRYVDQRLWYWFYGIDAATGALRWERSHNTGFKPKGGHGEQNRHPTIVGETVYAWPLAYHLHTGEPVAGWRFSRHGHGCGNVSASAHCLFWRGANPWMWDLRPGGGPTPLNRVSRPGCFINVIPAGGLVLIPEASSGCTCNYPIQTSVALAPARVGGPPGR